jgi:predicted nucleic acid-binding protein
MTSGELVMQKTLVDTDILSEYLRGKNANVARRADGYLREHGRLSLSVLTVFEIVRGRHQANQLERATQFLAWTRGAELVSFDEECARLGGEIAGALLRNGTTVGVADSLMAATAIVNGRVPGEIAVNDISTVSVQVNPLLPNAGTDQHFGNERAVEPSENALAAILGGASVDQDRRFFAAPQSGSLVHRVSCSPRL